MKKSLGANTFANTTPVWVVGTYGKDGTPNVMTATWAGIASSKPPCVSVSLREVTASYHNILRNKAFTISVPSKEHVVEADYFGMVSGKDVNKFEKSGMTVVDSKIVKAPYVDEMKLILECELFDTIEVGLHTVFIGEIKDVKADSSIIGEDGKISVEKLEPFSYDPSKKLYHENGKLIGQGFNLGNKYR